MTTTVARVRLLGDPVVGGVERVGHDHPLDQRMRRHAELALLTTRTGTSRRQATL